jgi:hypothetical protein
LNFVFLINSGTCIALVSSCTRAFVSSLALAASCAFVSALALAVSAAISAASSAVRMPFSWSFLRRISVSLPALYVGAAHDSANIQPAAIVNHPFMHFLLSLLFGLTLASALLRRY